MSISFLHRLHTPARFDLKNWTVGERPTFMESLTGSTKYTPEVSPLTTSLSTAAGATGGGGASGGSGGSGSSGGSIQKNARRLLVQFGWGDQFSALNSIAMAESGWNPRIKNPGSGALGIAQALGHGTADTQGTLGNEYGGFGLTAKEARAANSGDGYWQLVWMLHYIKQQYGSPDSAWTFHKANGWY